MVSYQTKGEKYKFLGRYARNLQLREIQNLTRPVHIDPHDIIFFFKIQYDSGSNL
jgi:hypothetical protein